jgi:hypothetical protein
LSIRGPLSFQDLLTNRDSGTQYATFQEAAASYGLIQDDTHHVSALNEAISFASPYSLRVLFCIILVFGEVQDPLHLFQTFKENLMEDLSESADPEQELLLRLDVLLRAHGKSLSADFPNLPPLQARPTENTLLRDERNYDREQESVTFNNLFGRLNLDQLRAFNRILALEGMCFMCHKNLI